MKARGKVRGSVAAMTALVVGLGACQLHMGVIAAQPGPPGPQFWRLEGNAGTTPGPNFLGTTDNKALELKVNNQRAFRLEPTGSSPNLIGGFSGNSVGDGVHGATIAGGGGSFFGKNQVTANFGTVGGGDGNTAGGQGATVGGGNRNTAGGLIATVGGGQLNTASDVNSTVGGGASNTASGGSATVGGGNTNTASNNGATVGGGSVNTASGVDSTLGGGQQNAARGHFATVGGGGGNTAGGVFATVAGGQRNTADGDYSFAAGRRAKIDAAHAGAFLFADSAAADFASAAANEFAARAEGGVRFVVGSQSCSLNSTTGAWACTSDRDAKAGLAPVDGREVLARLAELPIASWSFRGADPAVRHLGPTAQDFHAAFGAGADDKTISSIDADGVALAAIQGLYRVVQEKDAQLASLQQQSSTQQEQIAALREQNAALEARLQAVEQKLGVSEVGAVPSGPSLPSSWPLLGGLALAGLAVGPRLRRG